MNENLKSMLSEWFAELPSGVNAVVLGNSTSFSVLRADANTVAKVIGLKKAPQHILDAAVHSAIAKNPNTTPRNIRRLKGAGLVGLHISEIHKSIARLLDAGLIRVERSSRPGGGHVRVSYFPVDAS